MSRVYIPPHRQSTDSNTTRPSRSLSDLIVRDARENHVVTAIGTDKVYVIRDGYRCWLRGKGACPRHTGHRMGELVDGVQWMRVITDHELWAYPKGHCLR